MFTANTLLPWFVLLLPLASAVVITLFTRRWKNVSSYISVAAILGSFFCSCAIFVKADISAPEFNWIYISGVFSVPIAFVLDDLSRLMLLVVSGVGSLIHIYSLGYMRDDEGKSRYFAALSDRKSTRLNSSHRCISYAVFCLKKKNVIHI